MKEKEGRPCVPWLLGTTDGPHPVNTHRAQGPAQAYPSQATGLAPLHHSPALCLFPGFPAPTSRHLVWFLILGSFFSAVTNSSSARLLIPLFLSFPPALAACLLAQPLRVGMLLLLTSLSFPLLASQTYPLPALICYTPALWD